jgi:hypothetical protein
MERKVAVIRISERAEELSRVLAEYLQGGCWLEGELVDSDHPDNLYLHVLVKSQNDIEIEPKLLLIPHHHVVCLAIGQTYSSFGFARAAHDGHV